MGVGITDAEPGSVRGTHLVVSDIEAAHAQLVEAGVGHSFFPSLGLPMVLERE